jgi:hypothetical protein
VKINRRLHLVIPIYSDEEGSTEVTAQVHSTPLAEESVDRWHKLLGQTYAAIFQEGLAFAAGPGHAARMLKDIAIKTDIWFDRPDGTPGAERGLMEEIRRLTNVAVLNKDDKWEAVPLHVAVTRGVISAEDKTEVENAIVFFIAACATLPRAHRAGVVRPGAVLFGALLTSLPFTEWMSSSKTLTETVNFGEKSPAPASDAKETAPAPTAAKRSRVVF